MPQLWKGRFKKKLAKETNDFNSSISFDSRMFEEDIKGSIAHATMLGATGIIDKSESEKIVAGLSEILADIKSGKLDIDMSAEDIHTLRESLLRASVKRAKGFTPPARETTKLRLIFALPCARRLTKSVKKSKTSF